MRAFTIKHSGMNKILLQNKILQQVSYYMYLDINYMILLGKGHKVTRMINVFLNVQHEIKFLKNISYIITKQYLTHII